MCPPAGDHSLHSFSQQGPMLKRIAPSDARIGMFIHKLEGNWFRHPFWKGRFLLTDPGQLARLREAQVEGVIIDTARGRDVDGSPPEPEAAIARPARCGAAWRRAGPDHAPNPAPPPAAPPASGRSLAREFGRAAQIAEGGLRLVSRVFLEMRLGKAVRHDDISPVIEDIFASVQRNAHAFNGLMQCKRDAEFAYRHALATSALMIMLGRQLRLSPDALREAGLAGLMLDCGIGLMPVDLAVMGGHWRAIPAVLWREHVRYGHDFLLGGDCGEGVARACLEHHERMDGAGYPAGTPGEGLSPLGRMAAICNAYDELVSDMDGGGGIDPAAALARMLGDAGAYDGAMLKAFVAAVGIYPVGSIVLLQSGRHAMVVDQNEDDPALPRVRCFHSRALGRAVAQETIDLAHCYGRDAIAGLADPDDLPGEDLHRLRARLLAAACAI